MDNLKEFEVKDLSKVVGGNAAPGGELTVKIEGVLDGIPHNTKITIDGKATI